jgi:lysophospholipase L1-like esterase
MTRFVALLGIVAPAVGATLVATPAGASTVTQNVSWTITRSGAPTTYRITAYGDSIYAGYNGGLSSVARRAAPHVAGEYASLLWNSNIQVYRRTKSGAIASDIYNNKIVAERSYMQSTNTRVVTVEMCGNDYLQARSALNDQTGTCSYAGLDTALNNCTTYMTNAMNYINTNAYSGTKLKVISNLYYPGYGSDNALTACKDAATGQPVNKQQKFMPYLARSNWRTCSLAAQRGWQCADSFAQYMGADYDSNGDGLIDSEALRYRDGESEADYVTRVTVTLRSTVRDANTHFASSSTSYDYIQSDNTHPTYSGSTVYVGFFGGTGSGSGAAQYTDAQMLGGKNPIWNQNGHDRMGWTLSTFLPPAP